MEFQPTLVAALARVWTCLLPRRRVPARLSDWVRTTDNLVVRASLAVVAFETAAHYVAPLGRLAYNGDADRLTTTGRFLAYLLGPSFFIVGAALLRFGIALDARAQRTELRSLDGWFPLRGRWLGFVLSGLLVLLGAGFVLIGVANFASTLLLGPDPY